MENQDINTWVMLAKVVSHEANSACFNDFEEWLHESSDNSETYQDIKHIWSNKNTKKINAAPFNSQAAFARLDRVIKKTL